MATKKALDYARAVLKLANALGLIIGNVGELAKVPRAVKKPKAQPALTLEQFVKLYNVITNPRDRLILKVLFLGGVRRGELFVIQWKDWDGKHTLKIERSFDSQTHRVKE